jgi:uncharacterized protein (DUF1800 family)
MKHTFSTDVLPIELRRQSSRIYSILLCLALAACGGAESEQSSTQSENGSETANTSLTSPDTDNEGSVTESPNNEDADTPNDPGENNNDDDNDSTADDGTPTIVIGPQPTSRIDASRLLQQASFGPSIESVDTVSTQGARSYVTAQFAAPISRYRYTLPDAQFREQLHSQATQDNFCDRFAQGSSERQHCWRDWKSAIPVHWDFYQQAISGQDQLRQRVAFSLSQILVTSASKIEGTYALAHYQQLLRDHAFDNYRTLLKKVTLSPYMGKYLDMVDNAGENPNENYAREMLQLFSLGTCLLNPDGSYESGQCVATFDNEIVRNYAHALTGWTYPVGGVNPWCDECNGWTNPPFYRGDMVADPEQHDDQQRELLSGISVPAGRTPEQALETVLDSIMSHQNLAPFVSRQLIQFLVTSNPSPAYIARVAQAFNTGIYTDQGGNIGSGQTGDMQATIAAVLLDPDARSASVAEQNTFGRLREPALYIAGAIRALNGQSDGVALGSWGNWSIKMGQDPFNAPSVFNFYPPSFPLAGTELIAPQFGINNTNTVLARINFANALIYWWYERGEGVEPDDSVPGSTGTRVNYDDFAQALSNPRTDSIAVVSQLNDLLVDGRLPESEMQAIVQAMSEWTETEDSWLTDDSRRSSWQLEQVKTAAFLILSSPHYHIQR